MKRTNRNATERALPERVTVAVVQAASVAFNREKTLAKVNALAREAAAKGARLALFPEAFVSAYPRGLDFGAVVGSRSEEGREDFHVDEQARQPVTIASGTAPVAEEASHARP
jgi:predicted amidohydrolase